MVGAFRQYSKLLSASIFCQSSVPASTSGLVIPMRDDTSGDETVFPHIIVLLSSIFYVCRESLRDIVGTTLLDQGGSDNGALDGPISSTRHLRLQLELLMEQLRDVTKESLVNSEDKINLEVLLKFIGSTRID